VSAARKFPNGRAAAKAYAAEHGITGRKGGWLYNDRGRTVCQGWDSYVAMLTRRGIIRDLDGLSLSVFSGTSYNGRPVRNVFDREPVLLIGRES
jgi:hypothetical protein